MHGVCVCVCVLVAANHHYVPRFYGDHSSYVTLHRYVCVCMYAYVNPRVNTHIYAHGIYMAVCMYVCMCVYVYMYIYGRIQAQRLDIIHAPITYIHTYIHTCIHTYIHRRRRSQSHAKSTDMCRNASLTYMHAYIHACMHTQVKTWPKPCKIY